MVLNTSSLPDKDQLNPSESSRISGCGNKFKLLYYKINVEMSHNIWNTDTCGRVGPNRFFRIWDMSFICPGFGIFLEERERTI